MESLGRKTAMLVACFFYGLGTVLCATAGGMYTLIAARAVAGVSLPLSHDSIISSPDLFSLFLPFKARRRRREQGMEETAGDGREEPRDRRREKVS